MKALIFGSRGQDGFYLSKLLSAKGIDTIGISRHEADTFTTRHGDVANRDFVVQLIHQENPSYIFHLAANSTTRHNALFENHETISTGTLNILEGVRQYAPSSKVFITGSGVQFENTGAPIKETSPFKANNPYAISRIQSVYAARYFKSLGHQVYVGYLFHHESPLRKEHHVSKLIANQVRRISAGGNEKIKLGDVTVIKEWAYAGDIVEGIWTLVNQNHVHEATIGTGQGHSIQDWLDVCFELIGKSWKEYVEIPDPDFKSEYPVLISDPTTIRELGWSHKTSLRQLAQLMMQADPHEN